MKFPRPPNVPSTWQVHSDPVLFNTYGFALFDPSGPNTGGHERCVSCRANDPGDSRGNGDGQFDVKDSSGAKFYTRFYHGRWMRG